jgi:hypothetical protein
MTGIQTSAVIYRFSDVESVRVASTANEFQERKLRKGIATTGTPTLKNNKNCIVSVVYIPVYVRAPLYNVTAQLFAVSTTNNTAHSLY